MFIWDVLHQWLRSGSWTEWLERVHLYCSPASTPLTSADAPGSSLSTCSADCTNKSKQTSLQLADNHDPTQNTTILPCFNTRNIKWCSIGTLWRYDCTTVCSLTTEIRHTSPASWLRPAVTTEYPQTGSSADWACWGGRCYGDCVQIWTRRRTWATVWHPSPAPLNTPDRPAKHHSRITRRAAVVERLAQPGMCESLTSSESKRNCMNWHPATVSCLDLLWSNSRAEYSLLLGL